MVIALYCTELFLVAFLLRTLNHAFQKAELRENNCSCRAAKSKAINLSVFSRRQNGLYTIAGVSG